MYLLTWLVRQSLVLVNLFLSYSWIRLLFIATFGIHVGDFGAHFLGRLLFSLCFVLCVLCFVLCAPFHIKVFFSYVDLGEDNKNKTLRESGFYLYLDIHYNNVRCDRSWNCAFGTVEPTYRYRASMVPQEVHVTKIASENDEEGTRVSLLDLSARQLSASVLRSCVFIVHARFFFFRATWHDVIFCLPAFNYFFSLTLLTGEACVLWNVDYREAGRKDRNVFR